MSSEGNIKQFDESVRSATSRANYRAWARPTMLIADDHEDSLLYASEAAKYLGYDVVSTDCGQEVLTLALNHSPDVILLDLLLKDTHGKEIFQQLQNSRSTANIPVIAVTAMITELDKLKGSDLNFSGFLEKPYLIEDLAAALNGAQVSIRQMSSAPTQKEKLIEKENRTEKEELVETANRLHQPIFVN